ncbi:MAG: HlyD family efflux transporter periplasmic adaptor subunit, partial [Spirochaetia bacterium]|nr:HlyD family efflux transporter periplasmic adaptor subunit [Spirochaetia bacterium]
SDTFANAVSQVAIAAGRTLSDYLFGNSKDFKFTKPLPVVLKKSGKTVMITAGLCAALGLDGWSCQHKIENGEVSEEEIKKASLNLAQGSLREASEQWSTVSSLEDERVISKEEINKRKSSYLSAKAKLDQAKAEILLVENTLKMMTVYSPISGDVLQVNIKEGEYVSPGGLSATVMVGVLDPLHVRVDIDESEIPRVNKNARAVGYLRGSKKIKKELQFVRFESFVSSKKATGESDERSDTRVLQALYKMERGVEEFFVGQRMDVYIEEIGVNK